MPVQLKGSIDALSSTVRFRDVAGKTFKWKGNGPGLAFEVLDFLSHQRYI